jgi:hypothetical protein
MSKRALSTEMNTRNVRRQHEEEKCEALLLLNFDIFRMALSFLPREDLLSCGECSPWTQHFVTRLLVQQAAWPVEQVFDQGGIVPRVRPFLTQLRRIRGVLNIDQLVSLQGLAELSFGVDFNQTIAEGVLSGSLTQLSFGQNFNQAIEEGVLPDSLALLSFGRFFNQPIAEGVLPNSLKQLEIGQNFNQPIAEGVLPDSLTQLSFGRNFNQPITEGVLPGSLTHLRFGFHFNQPITDGVLPDSLTQINLWL